ncbi:MAG: hypothetical protein ABI376_07615 [Caulobacteraceae bacterium]
MLALLVALQAVQVAILWLHDWLPLPPFIDAKAVQAADTRARLVRVTLVQSVPYTVGLLGSIAALAGHPQGWLRAWLWVSYGLLFAGELRAWWVPYLLRPEPERAVRYRAMFGATHAFLPVRNGIVPNTLHCVLHSATVGTLLTLAFVSFHAGG